MAYQSPLAATLNGINSRGMAGVISNDWDPSSGGGVYSPEGTIYVSENGHKAWVHTSATDPNAYTPIHLTAPT